MLNITQTAKDKVIGFMDGKQTYLRIEITGHTASEYLYRFFLDDQKKDSDVEATTEPFTILVQKKDEEMLEGATVDWLESVNGSGFKVENPNKPTNNLDSEIAQKIQKLLDEEVNTAVSAHGGNIELLDVIEDRAYVKMGGGCQGCSSAALTLKQGVETRIKAAFPEIKQVIDTTDHASGQNPYYAGSGHAH
ncbi:MAG: NifU family protein [Proteobacteria bacterium]|nr:NifU family protein [Pseudomonadota bacterium]